MKITEVTATVGLTVNLGDFNFVRMDFTGKATLDEPVTPNSPDLHEANKELATALNKSLRKTIRGLYPDA